MLRWSVFFCSSFFLCAPALAERSALVLAVDGQGLLPALRQELEAGVRDALLRTSDPGSKRLAFSVATEQQTAAVLADAGSAGLACSVEDVSCLVRIGVIAGVDDVFQPSAVLEGGPEGSRVQLRVLRVDVNERKGAALAAGIVTPPSRDKGESVDRVITRLVSPCCTLAVDGPKGSTVRVAGVIAGTLPLPAPLAVEAGARDVQALDGVRLVARQTVTVLEGAQSVTLTSSAPNNNDATEKQKEQPPPPSSPSTLVIAGGATLGIGALLGLGGGLGVVVVEAGLGAPKAGADDPADIESQRTLGLVMIGSTVAGVAAVVAGGVILGVGLAP